MAEQISIESYDKSLGAETPASLRTRIATLEQELAQQAQVEQNLRAEITQLQDVLNATGDILFKLDRGQRGIALYGQEAKQRGLSAEAI